MLKTSASRLAAGAVISAVLPSGTRRAPLVRAVRGPGRPYALDPEAAERLWAVSEQMNQ